MYIAINTTLSSNVTTSSQPLDGSGGTSFYDIFGVVLGVISSIGLAPLVYVGIKHFLPTKRLRFLDETLDETISLYASVAGDGMFPNPGKVKSVEHQLQNLRRDANRLRAKVHVATTFKKQVHAWWCNVSRDIDRVRRTVEEVRADISVTCSKERQRRQQENYLLRPQLLPPSVYAASQVFYANAPTLQATPSSVSSRLGISTGRTGPHLSQSNLTPRGHAYPPSYMSTSNLLPNPPLAYQPDDSTTHASPQPDPHQKLRDLTDQLSRSLGDHGRTDVKIVHTPDHVACCNAEPGTSELQRNLRVLNDLTTRLSIVAASELLKSQNERGPSGTAPSVDPKQLALLVDAISAAQASQQSAPSPSIVDAASTATIVEVDDGLQDGSQPESSSSTQLIDV